MKKILGLVFLIVAGLLGYMFAVLNFPEATGGEEGFAAKLIEPVKEMSFAGVGVLVVGVLFLLGALYFFFARPGGSKALAASSGKGTSKYSYLARKSKVVEAGFLLNCVVALAVLALMLQGTVKGWFDDALLGALGAVFVLQILMGFFFFIFFVQKSGKAVFLFMVAMVLFLFEIAVAGYGLTETLK